MCSKGMIRLKEFLIPKTPGKSVSKPYIGFENKAPVDLKAEHTREYVSILNRLATQSIGLDIRL
jgi:hypothetical protein